MGLRTKPGFPHRCTQENLQRIPDKFGPEFIVNTSQSCFENQPCVTALANGGLVVTWVDTKQFQRRHDHQHHLRPHLQPIRHPPDRRVPGAFDDGTGSDHPQCDSVGGRRFHCGLVRCRPVPGYPSLTTIRAQGFDAKGGKIGAEFQVNTTVTNDQSEPSVTNWRTARTPWRAAREITH